ncbi:MAG: gluconokinase [Paraglaciecola sp.]|jgi:gluconokinase
MKRPANLVIVMGVSGSGKSTLGRMLAARLNYRFVEADDFHSQEAVNWMKSGNPLSDAMRQPWLARLTTFLSADPQCDTVMAYSGLRKMHRQRFRQLGYATRFILLQGEQSQILARMQQRADHFMPSSLLASQFSAMEPVDGEPDITTLDLALPTKTLLQQALTVIPTSESPSDIP